jgi:hypothetical protein
MKEGWKWGEKKEMSEDLGPSFNNLADLFDYELGEELKRLDDFFKIRSLREKIVDLIRRR